MADDGEKSRIYEFELDQRQKAAETKSKFKNWKNFGLIMIAAPIVLFLILLWILMPHNGSTFPVDSIINVFPNNTVVEPCTPCEISLRETTFVKNDGNTYSFYECHCNFNYSPAEKYSETCFQQLYFKLKRLTAILCEVKSMRSNLIFKKNNEIVVFYNHTMLEQIFVLLDHCFGNNGLSCTAFSARGAPYDIREDRRSDHCRYHVSIPKTLTICFAKDRFLTNGFVNKTIFDQSDIIYLYQIIKFWAIEPWVDLSAKTINSHLILGNPKYQSSIKKQR